MPMRASVLLGFSLCIVFTANSLFCQDSNSVGGVRTQIVGIDIPPVANAPFTARVLVTWNQPLVGGGTVSRKYYTQVARDSQGRVRRETRGFIPASSNAEPPLLSFAITDPVAGSRVTCTQDSMNCTVVDFRAPLFANEV